MILKLTIAHPGCGTIQIPKKNSKYVEYCKTFKSYDADSQLIEKRLTLIKGHNIKYFKLTYQV